MPRRARRVPSRGAAAAQSGSGAACRERVSRERQVRAGARSVRSRAVCRSCRVCQSSRCRSRARALHSPPFSPLSLPPSPSPPEEVARLSSRALLLESGGAERSGAQRARSRRITSWAGARLVTRRTRCRRYARLHNCSSSMRISGA